MKRYVAAMIRDAKTEEGLTEENFKVCSCNPANIEECALLKIIAKHLLKCRLHMQIYVNRIIVC